MGDLSDFAWLGVIVVWFLIRTVGGLLRRKMSGSTPSTETLPKSTASAPPPRSSGDVQRTGELSARPIEPK